MTKFTCLLFLTFLLSLPIVIAQTPTEKPPTASVTGRITLNNQPLPGVTVSLDSGGVFGVVQAAPRRPVTAKTDSDGRYRLAGIAAGQYLIAPRALAYVLPTEGLTGRVGKNLNLSDGEQIENMDFALVKGGVITGKITDYQDRPVIAQRVNLRQAGADSRAASVSVSSSNYFMFETDDRGVYRLYGLPAGRYTLSVGEGGEQNVVRMGRAGKNYPLTFYPNTRDEKAAKVIEVTEGSEATDINIKLPRSEKSYEAKGRVIDGSTGAPLAGIALIYRAVGNDLMLMGALGMTQERTTAQGEFTLPGLMPGKYAVMMQTMEAASDYYSDPLTFDMQESDTEGLEIKAYRGASISGIVVIEGATDPAILKQVANVRVSAYPAISSSSVQMPIFASNQTTNPDGTFRATGIRPGKIRLGANVSNPNVPLVMSRFERDGVEIPPALEITAGEQVTGIKVVMIYGSGIIRGQLAVVGGTLPPDAQFLVSALRMNAAVRTGSRPAQVDARGKFVLEGLAPGEYELILSPLARNGISPNSMPRSVRQKVTVGPGETPVTLTIDLSEKKEGRQ